MTLKISYLLAQYLYEHKRLHLPGIGIFSFTDAIPMQHADHKAPQPLPEQIQFVQKQVSRPEDELIEFIRVKTGKIKALAEADLDSFLNDGKTLLNLGKPFHIEGVGSLHKNRQGQLDFHTGEPAIEKMEMSAPAAHTNTTTDTAEAAAPAKKRSVFDEDARKGSPRRMAVVAAMILAALLVVIWGGYSLYNNHDANEDAVTPNTAATNDSSAVLTPDAARESSSLASSAKPVEKPAVSRTSLTPGNYRFIIETTYSKRRAMYRYTLLKSYDLDIRMDTPQDSSFFKLYFVFPAAAKDTLHIKDSLQRMYASKQILIEQ